MIGRRWIIAAACLACWGGTLFLATPTARAGKHLTDDQGVQAVEDAMGGWFSYPWYDANERQVKPVPVAPQKPPPGPSQWEAPPPATNTNSSANWEWFWKFLADLRDLFGTWLGWALLALLLAGLAAVLVYAFTRLRLAPLGGERRATGGTRKKSDIDRIEALPFQVDRPLDDLWSEAQRQYRAGNFRQAVVYYYSYLLVELDRAQRIRLARGKTNRQYLGEVRGAPDIAALLRDTMVAFEDVFFGNHDLSAGRFENVWSRHQDFQRWMQPGG